MATSLGGRSVYFLPLCSSYHIVSPSSLACLFIQKAKQMQNAFARVSLAPN